MCTIASQIIEVEMKIEQAQHNHAPQGEIDVLRHELEALEKQFEEKGNDL